MGLLHCHQHGIAHRDLKPENLLLDERLNIKVADFGMARFTTKGTYMSTTCGSPHYVSPEVIIGKYEGKTSDVWSLGVILYALTTGCLPFDHESIPELLKLIQAGVFTIPSDVDDDIADLIRRMMQVNVKDRILMEDIHTHYAFAGTWYFSKPPTAPEQPERLIGQTLDESIFEDVIALLGTDTRIECRANILSSGDSLEKSLYRLLMNRKCTRLANLHRLSPKITSRSLSAPPSPAHSPTPPPTDIPPSFDLGELKQKEQKSTVTSSPIAKSTSKPEFSDLLTKTFLKINMLENKDTMSSNSSGGVPSPPDSIPSNSPSGKVASTPTFTRRLSSHSKMQTSNSGVGGGSSGRIGELKPMAISPDPQTRRIFVQIETTRESSPGNSGPSRDFKPSPNISPFVTPDTSPYASPNISPATSRTPSPSGGPSIAPNSPVTRPWFAAFFKRRPSLDPYKPESNTPSPSNVSAVRAAIMNRLRARTSTSSPRRIQVLDVDQTARSSPRSPHFPFDTPTEMRDSSPSPVMPSPKLTARLEGLLQAAKTSVPQQTNPFRGTTLPVLEEEGETTRGA
jgi:serine/threonine protein kinase